MVIFKSKKRNLGWFEDQIVVKDYILLIALNTPGVKTDKNFS